MYEIRFDIVEQALVVGHQHDRTLGAAHRIDAVGDGFQRIDVETGVGLVENREARLEDRHLQDLVTFLFAARKPLVDAAIQKTLVHAEHRHGLARNFQEVERVHLFEALVLALCVDGRL